MDAVLKIVQTVNMYLSDYILIIMLIGCGLYFSFKTKFVQVRCFGEGWRKVFGNFSLHGGKHEGGMSSFQALATAIAAQVGTGNIVGACGAILVGGPGAIFWMWIIAFFGMSTIYAEAVLAQKTRVVNPDGTVAGGPVYYIKKAFNNGFGKFMAGFFAVAIILALGFMGAMVQSNSIGESCQNAFGIPSWVMGAIIAVICAFIFIGGAHRVAAVAEKLVPIMAILYVLGGLVVIICRIQYVPETFGMIFKYAFNPTAVIGGSIGFAIKQAISQGVKRGLFSNEAGVGSAPNAAATAEVSHPVKQGLVQMLSVFIDTLLLCTCTAMMCLCSGVQPTAEMAGAPYVQAALANALGMAGPIFINISMVLFAFTTLLGNFYYVDNLLTYIMNKVPSKTFMTCFRLVAAGIIWLGAGMSMSLVWDLADVLMGVMAIINIPVICILGTPAIKALKDYTAQKAAGKNPEFKSATVGLEGKTECWE